MKYKARLESIPMSVYMSLVRGEFDGEFDIPVKEARRKLMSDYMKITGGKRMLAEIMSRNDLLNAEITLRCLGSCLNLLQMQKKEDVIKIMSGIGYQIGESVTILELTKIVNRAVMMANLKIERIKARSKEKRPTDDKDGDDSDMFVRERVLLIEHYKMPIDTEKIMAAEYAYMIKHMSEEIERNNKAINRMRQKRN